MSETAPNVPGASDLAPATLAEVTARRAELFGNPEWREKYARGDVATRAEFDALHKTMAPLTAEQQAAEIADRRIAAFSRIADLPESVINQMRSGQPVSQHERNLALDAKARVFRDTAWVKRYLDGGRTEATHLAMISIILGSRVVEAK